MAGSAHRVTRRLAFAGVAALLAAGAGAPSVATAAEGDSERGFPELLPEWYVTASPYPYENAAPAPTVDESLKSKGFKVAYYRPGGGAPSSGQGDLELSYSHSPSAAAVDEVRFRFSDFESLSSDLGTIITDAIYLPIEDASTADVIVNEVAQSGGVYFSDSALVVNRQAEPCAVKKLQPIYEFQVALLGNNGYKYLADVAVNLGKRPESACATEKPKPAKETSTPVVPEAAAEVSDEETASVAEEATAEAEEPESTPRDDADGETTRASSPLPWMLLLIPLVVVVFTWARNRQKKRRKFHADASLIAGLAPQTGAGE